MAQMLKLNTTCKTTNAPWDPERTLAEALAERARFLKRHPRYQRFQAKIDRTLNKAGNADARMAVLAILMEAKLIELRSRLGQLNRILIKLAA